MITPLFCRRWRREMENAREDHGGVTTVMAVVGIYYVER
jgi:hypothetical protein